MRRRAPLFLALLAVVAVCLLLWETVLAPGDELVADGGGTGMLDEQSSSTAAHTGPDAEHDAPSLMGTGRPQDAAGRAGGPGALAAGGLEGPVAGGASDASVPFVGRVLTANGRPAAGVKILMSGPGGTQTIEADADGAFQHDAPPGRYTLYFDGGEDGGLLLASWMLDGADRDDLEFTLRDPGTVQVKVLRGQEPVADVAVALASRALGDLVHQEGKTDLDGVATFEGLVATTYDVTATVPDGPSVKGNMFARPGRTTTMRVRVPDGILFQGTVRAGKDGPGVPATLTLHTVARGSSGVFETVFESGSDGHFEVTVPKGTPRLFRVEADGYATWPTPKANRGVLRSLRGLYGKKPVTRNVVLETGAALSGKVLLEDKTPLSGVTLRFAVRRGPTASATSKPDGTYRILHLQPGRYDLQVETPGWFPTRDQQMRVLVPGGATPTPTTLDVTLLGARRLAGIVVDGDGKAIGGARVWIVGGGRILRSARSAGRMLEVFTNANGSWVIGDIPPDQNVSVRAAVGDLEADPVNVSWEHPPTEGIRLVVKGTGVIDGRVVDLDSREPVRGATLRIVPDPYDGRTSRAARSNARGEFRVERLIPGRWKVIPSARGYLKSEGEPLSVDAEKETSAEIHLDPGLVFGGVVVNANGAPLRYARVVARGTPDGKDKAMARSALTDVQGRFRLTGFEHGTYWVTIYRSAFKTLRLDAMRSSERELRVVLVPRKTR